MLDQVIQLVTILFLLSMVCERIADFLKHYLCGSDKLAIGDTITKFPVDDPREDARRYRILKINVWAGIIIATILKADLIKIFNEISNPGRTIGWGQIEQYRGIDYWLLLPGIVLTGCFISFGSKFWHDLLDLLYQIKNAKRILADPETYKVDNIQTLEKVFNTYQSEFIKAAFLEAKTQLMALEFVKAVSVKNNSLGYYFEVTLSQNNPAIQQNYAYLMDDGTPQSIPIRIVILTPSDTIKALTFDLSGQIFDKLNPANFGTLGVLVKPNDSTSTSKYLLTCCHNVISPLSRLPYTRNPIIEVGTNDNSVNRIGNVFKADRDHEMDAALIEIDHNRFQDLVNTIPSLGKPQKARQLFNRDAGKVNAFVYGATTGVGANKISTGIVTSIYNSIKVTYSKDEFTLINTIAISNEGKGISDRGDSGACVVDQDNNVLGIVVAGSSQVTYILPINTLLTKLNVQLI